MPAKTEFERAIEAATGESVEQLRDTPIDERRKRIEKRRRRRMRFIPHWPFIGRGNIIHGGTQSRDQINTSVDEALR